MKFIERQKLAETAAGDAPFPHLLCPDFIRADKLADIHRDFPAPPGAGSFPLSALRYGGAFAELTEEIRSPEIAEILAEKLQSPIVGRPTMITVRGFCRETDGKIHLDSGGKMVTVLLYLNRGWAGGENGGRLRLLRSGGDLDDCFLETPPDEGVLLAFRCDNNAWHGHLPFSGERRSIQLNWVVSDSYRRREAARHFVSATAKKVRAVFGRKRSIS